jgi:Dipeptidyl peptidase IV (DPP IV) N-terminal region/WD40-like Beta Propeller Repeat
MGQFLDRTRCRIGLRMVALVTLPVVVGAGALVAGTAHAARSNPHAYDGADGRIAFVRNGNIFTIKPAGTGLRKLTDLGHASGPRWSPDGKRLAYIYRGNLWVMNASGGGKTRITSAAPRYTDGRPTWSPNGRYLAFVTTQRGHRYGYLTRYDMVRRKFAYFTDTIEPPHLIKIAVLASSAVAWAWARDAGGVHDGSFLLYEGTGEQCLGNTYCLDALGFEHQYQYRNGFPSAEYLHSVPTRLTDPDWYPISPLFSTNVLTTVENCTSSPCTRSGLSLTIGAAPILAGAYEGVYSPDGQFIAYVVNVRGVPSVYTYYLSPIARFHPVFLAHGTEPDWQPLTAPPS